MEQFQVGETVVQREFPKGMRGEVVRAPDNGLFVTVKWTVRSGKGRESTHYSEDLMRVTD
jgi:hypothetical protein